MTDVEDDAGTSTATDQLRRRVADLEAEVRQLRDTHRIALEHERLRHREHALGLVVEAEAARDRNRLLAKRVTRLRERVQQLEEQRRSGGRREEQLRDELASVYGSRTWRAGRVLGRPVRGRRS